MFQPYRLIWIVLAATAVFAVSLMRNSVADPPQSTDEATLSRRLPELSLNWTIPDVPPEFVSEDRRGETEIRDALSGGLPAGFSGDPVLNEVLQVIQRRGSILDGSSLDSSPDASSKSSPTERAHAAEVLLRASRLLERVQPVDKTREDLVNRIRAEAVRLLAQEIP